MAERSAVVFERGACLRHSDSSGGVTSFGQDGAQRPRNLA